MCDICSVVLKVHGMLSLVGTWLSHSSAPASSACGAAGDGTVPSEMCPPEGPDSGTNLLENSAKDVFTLEDVRVKSKVVREEER